MRQTLSAAAFLLFGLTTSAQTFSFGAPFPLSNTRYGAAATEPKLVSAGNRLYVFWTTKTTIRMTHVVDGARRGGLPVFVVSKQVEAITGFDVVWTGERFVIAVILGGPAALSQRILTRAISTSAEPSASAPHNVINGAASSPALAFNGRTLLLLYWVTGPDGVAEVRSLPLAADGKPTGAASELVTNGRHADVASNGDGFAAVVIAGAARATLSTFDADGRVERTTALPVIEGLADQGATIASNGRDYLAVFTGLAEAWAIPVMATGELGSRVTLDARAPSPYRYGYLDPAVLWNGSEWIVTYTESDHQAPWHLIAATLAADAATVTSRERLEDTRSAATMAAVGGRTVVAWRSPSGFPSVPQIGELPLATNQSRELTFMAGEQTLRASATAGDTILVVWSERLNNASSIRAGVRTSAGHWSEQKLTDENASVLAASDGNEFVVFLSRTALRLDREGIASTPVELPFAPEAVTWTGTAYALVAGNMGVLFSPSGTVSAPVTLTSPTGRPAWPTIAFDGAHLLVAWATDPQCAVTGLDCYGIGISAARFRPDLTRLHATDLVLASGEQLSGPAAAWNGKEFVVTWTDSSRGQFAATVPGTGTSIRTTQLSTHTRVDDPRIVAAHGGVVVSGRDMASYENYINRFIFLDASGTVTEGQPFDHSGEIVTGTELQFAGGRLAYLTSQMIEAAPQHAATHVTMNLETQTTLPGAPELTADASPRIVKLTWTAASGPVKGYRVEYRLGDGAWNEIEQWFGTSERETTFRLSSAGQRAAFRVRAWSDGGTGAYSAPALVNAPRRRAVR